MGWTIGYDENWKRDIGYGVPAWCDHPNCLAEIDRGLAYVCGGHPYGGDEGCGLYFCYEHLYFANGKPQLCARCAVSEEPCPFEAKPDHPDWINHKATDPSWAAWRAEQGAEMSLDQRTVEAHGQASSKGKGLVMDDLRDNGCLCQRCHCRYRVDFMLPEELWAEIHGVFNLLCGPCIVELIEAREKCDYFHLVKLDPPSVIDPQSNFDDSVADDGSWVKQYSEGEKQ